MSEKEVITLPDYLISAIKRLRKEFRVSALIDKQWLCNGVGKEKEPIAEFISKSSEHFLEYVDYIVRTYNTKEEETETIAYTMGTKVSLPKQIAEDIESFHRIFPSVQKYILLTDHHFLREHNVEKAERLHLFASKNPIRYMIALVEGYEIEPTREEKFQSIYKILTDGEQELVDKLLNALEIDPESLKQYV